MNIRAMPPRLRHLLPKRLPVLHATSCTSPRAPAHSSQHDRLASATGTPGTCGDKANTSGS
eukprot:1922168-Pleurochrysis_carterae.AAC.1